MSKESKIQKKLNSLFESNKKKTEFEEQFFTPETKMQMEDLSPEEKKEVEEFVRQLESHKQYAPEKRWRWKFTGRILFKIILFLVEFAVLTFSIFILLPIAINTSITILQSFGIASLLTILKKWAN
jgi:hypothetical protein